ncbi:AAA family ATPase [Extibacter muris]|nr:AAA family ATPase [Extibacter muris]MCU0080330.1 AAA family ATPase [Extibacter muris]
MYQIKIKNCNNIAEGELCIEEEKLNILYGINGTGKTTIAKAIEFSKEPQKIGELQSFFTEDIASVSITPEVGKILVFNEDFVRDIVFKEDEGIIHILILIRKILTSEYLRLRNIFQSLIIWN